MAMSGGYVATAAGIYSYYMKRIFLRVGNQRKSKLAIFSPKEEQGQNIKPSVD
jgi:hypothetical protein